MWAIPSPKSLHQHLQPFTPWSAGDPGTCCPTLCSPKNATVMRKLSAFPFPCSSMLAGNGYLRTENRAEKQYSGEEAKHCVPDATTAGSDQPRQSAVGQGQCKTLAFSPKTSRHKFAPAWLCYRRVDSSQPNADAAVESWLLSCR